MRVYSISISAKQAQHTGRGRINAYSRDTPDSAYSWHQSTEVASCNFRSVYLRQMAAKYSACAGNIAHPPLRTFLFRCPDFRNPLRVKYHNQITSMLETPCIFAEICHTFQNKKIVTKPHVRGRMYCNSNHDLFYSRNSPCALLSKLPLARRLSPCSLARSRHFSRLTCLCAHDTLHC